MAPPASSALNAKLAATPLTPSGAAASREPAEKLSKERLVERLAEAEDELALYKLQAAKKLFSLLNQRIELAIDEWKGVQTQQQQQQQPQSQPPPPTTTTTRPPPPASRDAPNNALGALADRISAGRRAAEEALQLMVHLRPLTAVAGVPGTPAALGASSSSSSTTPSALPLAVKARWQGTPVSALKPVAVAHDWQATLAQSDPVIELGSGPAQRWRLRLVVPALDDDLPPMPPGTLGVGADAEIVIEALDRSGRLDDHCCSCVLLEQAPFDMMEPNTAAGATTTSLTPSTMMRPARTATPSVEGLGFVHIAGGVGRTTIRSEASGLCAVVLEDGHAHSPPLSAIEPPPPLPLTFVCGEPSELRLSASAPDAVAGGVMTLEMTVRDSFGNVVDQAYASGEVAIEAIDHTHAPGSSGHYPASLLAGGGGAEEVEASDAAEGGGAVGGDRATPPVVEGLGVLSLSHGVATTEVSVEAASAFVIKVGELNGFDGAAELAQAASRASGPPAALPYTFKPGPPAYVVLVLPADGATRSAGGVLVAGRPFQLEVHVRDRCGNTLSDPALYAHLRVSGRTVAKGVAGERSYEVTMTRGRGIISAQTESTTVPACFWLSLWEMTTSSHSSNSSNHGGGGGSGLPPSLSLIHARSSPLSLTPIPAEPTHFLLGRVRPPMHDADFEAVINKADEAAAAAAAAAAETEAAERAEADSVKAHAEGVGLSDAKRAEVEAAVAAEAAAEAEAEVARSLEEQSTREAEKAEADAILAAQRAAEAKAKAEAATSGRAEAEAALASAAGVREAAEAEAAALQAAAALASDAKDAATAAVRAAWAEQQSKEAESAAMLTKRERADAARKEGDLMSGSPVGETVSLEIIAQDMFGNVLSEGHHTAKMGEVDVDIYAHAGNEQQQQQQQQGGGGKGGAAAARKKGGAARFTASGKDKLAKVDMSHGSAMVELQWNEGEGSRPVDPLTGTGLVSVVLTRQGVKEEMSSLEVLFRHGVAARAVLGRERDVLWEGERAKGKADLIGQACAGTPLAVPVRLVDRFGCTCGHAPPTVVRVQAVGKASGETSVVECRVVHGCGVAELVRTIAEEVAISVVEEDRVLDAKEDVNLSARQERHAASGGGNSGKPPPKGGKGGGGDASSASDGRTPLLDYFADKVELRVSHSEPCALTVKPIHMPTPPPTTKGSKGAAKPAPQHSSVAAGGGGVVEAAVTAVTAGIELEVVVTAVDAFRNPTTDAAYWAASKRTINVELEEQALPKPQPHTLLLGQPGMDTLRLPSGSKPHTITETASGELKRLTSLSLKGGEARTKVKLTVAGELHLNATHAQQAAAGAKGGGGAAAKGGGGGEALLPALAAGSASVTVRADHAESFDLVPLDQGGGGMRVMVHARDAYGNLDEACNREVLIEFDEQGGVVGAAAGGGGGGDGSPSRLGLPHGGLVKLTNGVAEVVAGPGGETSSTYSGGSSEQRQRGSRVEGADAGAVTTPSKAISSEPRPQTPGSDWTRSHAYR